MEIPLWPDSDLYQTLRAFVREGEGGGLNENFTPVAPASQRHYLLATECISNLINTLVAEARFDRFPINRESNINIKGIGPTILVKRRRSL